MLTPTLSVSALEIWVFMKSDTALNKICGKNVGPRPTYKNYEQKQKRERGCVTQVKLCSFTDMSVGSKLQIQL